jgi:hypothetical protein
MNRCCEQAGKNDADPDPLLPLFFLEWSSLNLSNLTPPLFWIQERLGVDLVELKSHRHRPDTRFIIPGSDPPFPPTVEIAVLRRVA